MDSKLGAHTTDPDSEGTVSLPADVDGAIEENHHWRPVVASGGYGRYLLPRFRLRRQPAARNLNSLLSGVYVSGRSKRMEINP